jgi:MFS family permease
MRAVFNNVTTEFISSLASIFYIGILFGSLTSGLLADKYGRRRLIIYGAVMQIAVALMFYLATSLTTMFFLRFCYGYSFGFTVAITTSMFAEVTPSEYRGKGILLINFCISLGKLYGVGLGYLFLN